MKSSHSRPVVLALSGLFGISLLIIGCDQKLEGADSAKAGEKQADGKGEGRGGGKGEGKGGGKGSGPDSGARPVPVTTYLVAKKDMPIYLDGLGTVSAFKTVTIHSQVDGKLEKVPFKEGDFVKKGALLGQIDARPFVAALHQAEGALARDTAALQDNKLNLDRYVGLRKQNLVAQQQVDDQKSLVGQNQGNIGVDLAQIETAKLNLEYCHITAPLDGVLGVRQVDEGNLIHQADATGLVVLTQIDPIAVFFTLPQDDLHRVTEQMAQRTLSVEAYSREGDKLLGNGELLVLDNQINQNTATLRLKAVFPNPKRLLWPNQFVKSRLLLTVAKDALVIPATGIQRGPKGTFAYVVSPENTASTVNIEIDTLVGDQAIIAKGLEPGQQVVIEGANQLREGAKVNPRQSKSGAKS
jgi:multidrug efflux system membrane fusion protein